MKKSTSISLMCVFWIAGMHVIYKNRKKNCNEMLNLFKIWIVCIQIIYKNEKVLVQIYFIYL